VSAIFWVANRVTIKDDNKQNSYLVKYVSLTNNSSVFYLAKFTPSLVGVYFPRAFCHPKMAAKAWERQINFNYFLDAIERSSGP
jgi:hypothetical protein